MEKTSLRISYAPSYMAHIKARPSRGTECLSYECQSALVGAQVQVPVRNFGFKADSVLLLVMIAGPPETTLVRYFQTVLGKHSITNIIIVGSRRHEAAIKQLKMDTYNMIGRTRREVAVHAHCEDFSDTGDLDFLLEDIMYGDPKLQGVLCCPEYDPADRANTDVIENLGAEVEHAMRQSVAFTHGVARACINHLDCLPDLSDLDMSSPTRLKRRDPFFIVANPSVRTPLARVTWSACSVLVTQLQNTNACHGISIGFSEKLLSPPPARERGLGRSTRLKPAKVEPRRVEPAVVESCPDSPTKLWSMWARANSALMEKSVI